MCLFRRPPITQQLNYTIREEALHQDVLTPIFSLEMDKNSLAHFMQILVSGDQKSLVFSIHFDKSMRILVT